MFWFYDKWPISYQLCKSNSLTYSSGICLVSRDWKCVCVFQRSFVRSFVRAFVRLCVAPQIIRNIFGGKNSPPPLPNVSWKVSQGDADHQLRGKKSWNIFAMILSPFFCRFFGVTAFFHFCCDVRNVLESGIRHKESYSIEIVSARLKWDASIEILVFT